MCCFIAGCQTTKPKPAAIAAPASPAAAPAPPIAPGQSLIQTEARGFSPSAENGRTAIEFALLFSNADAVKSWQVAIASDKGGQRKFSGDGSKLPSTLEWDGKTDSGATAPDGSYTAALSIDYGDAFEAATATSKPFILDSAKPAGSIRLSPALFSPVEPTDRVTISIDASSSLAKLDSWSLEIYDPGGNLFKSFDGKWPTDSVAWDGKGIKGDLVVSAEDYPVVAKLRDEFGNVGLLKSTIPIDIIVIKQADGYRIPNSRVYFKAFTADYRDVAPDLAAQNATRLDRLAETLKKFPGYRIKIMGHAVMIHWDDPALGKIEEDSVLVPLSKARAEAIKHAMADRGLEPAMIETDGVGAADPLVPDSDYANRWQNRRTAIFLVK
jgi:hypothetical protein